jgi:hypothetical protein
MKQTLITSASKANQQPSNIQNSNKDAKSPILLKLGQYWSVVEPLQNDPKTESIYFSKIKKERVLKSQVFEKKQNSKNLEDFLNISFELATQVSWFETISEIDQEPLNVFESRPENSGPISLLDFENLPGAEAPLLDCLMESFASDRDSDEEAMIEEFELAESFCSDSEDEDSLENGKNDRKANLCCFEESFGSSDSESEDDEKWEKSQKERLVLQESFGLDSSTEEEEALIEDCFLEQVESSELSKLANNPEGIRIKFCIDEEGDSKNSMIQKPVEDKADGNDGERKKETVGVRGQAAFEEQSLKSPNLFNKNHQEQRKSSLFKAVNANPAKDGFFLQRPHLKKVQGSFQTRASPLLDAKVTVQKLEKGFVKKGLEEYCLKF